MEVGRATRRLLLIQVRDDGGWDQCGGNVVVRGNWTGNVFKVRHTDGFEGLN